MIDLRSILICLFVILLLAAQGHAQAQTPEQKAALAEAERLNGEAFELYRAGKFSDAELLLRRSLAIREKVLGPEHPNVAASLNNLAELYRAQNQYAQAEPLYRRSLAILEKALGTEHPDVATGLGNLASLYEALGQYAQAEPLYRRSLAIREKVLGPEHPNVAESLENLVGLYLVHAKYAQVEPLLRRSLAIKQKLLGPEHLDVATALNNLADLYEALGQYAQAEPLLLRSLAIREKVLGPEDPELVPILHNLAGLYRSQAKYAQTELLYRRALAIVEKAGGPEHPAVAVSLNHLVELYREYGQYAQAEPLLRRSLAVLEGVVGPGNIDMLTSLNNLAEVYIAQGQYAQAEPLLRRSLATTIGSTGLYASRSFDNLALIYLEQGQYAQVEPLYRRSLAIREEVLGPEHPGVTTSLSNLARLYLAQGQYAQAEPLLRRSLAIREEVLGPEHLDVATSLNNLGYMLAGQRQHRQARAMYERGRRIYLTVSRVNIDLDEEALRGLLKGGHGAIRDYVKLLATIARDPTLDSSPGSAERDAFVVAEQVKGGTAQAALAKSGARGAAGDPTTATLVREVQELRNRRQAVGKQLTEEYGKPAAQRNAERLKNLKETVEKLDRELKEAVNRLNKAFPKYAELASPEPIDIVSVQRLLRSGEALASYFTLDDRLLVWLVRQEKEVVYKDIEIKKADLAKLVARVRTSLDQSTNPNLAVGELLPFDVAGSHELFKLLVAPLRDQLSGVKQLIFVPDELLLPIPFGALVTRAEGEPYQALINLYEKRLNPSAAEFAGYAKLSWLAKDYAITVLPSATSLRALRQISRPKSADVEPFIGFGDPALRGRGTRRGGAMLASRGTGVSVDDIQKMDGLPGTRVELLAVAKALGVNPNEALYLGKQATKPMVVKLNSSARLEKARVVSFATHGLIGGEVKGLKEPALVLTPPEKPSEEDNGLLGLEDILSLKLTNADWVILSACNTAGADGSSEGLSGLVRAFFFAGTPSLLVSHWSVEDRATQALMTEVFLRYAQDKTVARSEALRQGMLALMTGAKGPTAYFAHPFAWAPFFLVGEGAGARE